MALFGSACSQKPLTSELIPLLIPCDTRVAHKRDTLPKTRMFSLPRHWEVLHLSLDAQGFFLPPQIIGPPPLSRAASPVCYLSHPGQGALSLSDFPGRSACPRRRRSLQILAAPTLPILPDPPQRTATNQQGRGGVLSPARRLMSGMAFN